MADAWGLREVATLDPWTFLPSPLNTTLSEPLLYNSSFFNDSDFSSANGTEHEFHTTSTVVVTFIYFVVCAVGLCGNALVIYVILRHAKMKTVTNIYILNLAVADVLCMLSLPFIAIQLALVNWPFGSVLCRIVMTADSLNQFTSIFCLTVMSVDRYLAVVHPIRSTKWRKPRMAKSINVAVWCVSLLVNLPVMIYSGLLNSRNNGARSCTIVWPKPQSAYYTAFIFYTFLLGFVIPLTVICLCYLLIVVKVKSSGIQVCSSKRKRSERKVTRMVSIVVAVFVLCWLPFYVFNVTSVTVSIKSTPAHKSTFDFVVVLGYANSCANPVLYAFLSENFKKSFENILCILTRGGGRQSEKVRGDGRPNRTRMVNEVTETQSALLNGDLQTSI
ncbi:hypothetical protein GJAV_G00266580 [Gymnothorax javanicus]|nr:hypothetical protein GJAV_G00266580 [Gymnothorax javanicus]